MNVQIAPETAIGPGVQAGCQPLSPDPLYLGYVAVLENYCRTHGHGRKILSVIGRGTAIIKTQKVACVEAWPLFGEA